MKWHYIKDREYLTDATGKIIGEITYSDSAGVYRVYGHNSLIGNYLDLDLAKKAVEERVGYDSPSH